MPWPSMKAIMSSLSESRSSGCIIKRLLSQKQRVENGEVSPIVGLRSGVIILAKFERHVFVCTNVREPGSARPSCTNDGIGKLHGIFKDKIKDAGLKNTVRANKAGCLDQCEHGPTVVVYPEAVWYGRVTPEDVDEIVTEHLVHGRTVERLMLPDECINTSSCPHRLS